MTVETIQALITSVGFPIVCVISLAWFIYKSYEKITERTEQREDKLYQVITSAQEQNQKLSETNAQFVTVLSTYKDDLEEIKANVAEIKQNI